jgi:hypothetical protein
MMMMQNIINAKIATVFLVQQIWCHNCLLTLSNPIFLLPAYSPALIYFGLERGWWITCPYYEEKRRTGSDSGAGERNKKTCRTSSDIGAEQENHNVGRGPTLDRKGLTRRKYSIYILFQMH